MENNRNRANGEERSASFLGLRAANNNVQEEVPEERDSAAVLEIKCQELAELIKGAKYTVFFLGAGISASQLPTYRGTNGLWTSTAHQNELADAKVSNAKPTLAHRALVALEKFSRNYAYHVVTQNIDDLSRKSGFAMEKVTELHGNIFTESCPKCFKIYRRGFEVTQYNDSSGNHETGRTCEKCGGPLMDTVLHFGEPVPEGKRTLSTVKFRNKDLCVVLGSSLQVEPASSLPFKCQQVCIVNLQPTIHDKKADLLIRGECDQVMDAVAKKILGENWDDYSL